MKTVQFNTLILVIFLALFSCSQEGKKEDQKKTEKSSDDKEHDHEEDELRLVDGKKWQVNPETTKGVENMTGIVNDFDINSEESKYIELFDTLDAEFRYIFKMCSVEGEAHDQLHVMLFPLRGMFNDLKSPEEQIRKEGVEKIKNQLAQYPEYFESNE